MSVGKSTLAGNLARHLGIPHGDSDDDMAALTGVDAAEYAATHGVAGLHRLEAAILLGRLAVPGPSVVSAAASTIEDEACRVALRRRAHVIWLDLDIETLRQRLAHGGHRRPMSGDEVRRLAERRRPLFEAVADLTLDARESPAALFEQALADLGA